MSTPIVLVAFASQSGSTAGIAEVIATELRAAGVSVDCRVSSEVPSLAGYEAVVLGSGVFVRSRATDGGGFLIRFREVLPAVPVWLFCAGPIGRGGSPDAEATESAVMDVARTIGARGAAAFGCQWPGPPPDALDRVPVVDAALVRAWGREIAAALGQAGGSLAEAS